MYEWSSAAGPPGGRPTRTAHQALTRWEGRAAAEGAAALTCRRSSYWAGLGGRGRHSLSQITCKGFKSYLWL